MLRVLLLFGGRSAEHDVSRISASSVARALDPAKYDVIPVAITKSGQWLLAAGVARGEPPAFEVEGQSVTAVEVLSDSIDVVVPLLHGPYGEDGTVQGLFELAGVPYVGAGVVGSAVGMDKVMMKRAFEAAGLPVVKWLVLRDGGNQHAFAARVADELGFPCFVKPANMGSSVGVSKVHDPGAFDAAIARALDFDEWVIVEEAIDGREIEVGILGDDPPEASVAGEVVPGDVFYSYADKYEHDEAKLVVPAELTSDEAAVAQSLAVRAFEACRGEAMARVDCLFEVRPNENAGAGAAPRGFLVNEVNTIPGFTPISMYPRLWQASGVPYAALLDRLIELALARHERRQRRAGRQRDE